MDKVIRIAGNNIPVPATILDAIPQWWGEFAGASSQLSAENPVVWLAVPYGVDDRVMVCDDEDDTPIGWWTRFRLRLSLETGYVELADVLTGNRYDATLLTMFFNGLIAPDVDDSLEILQITNELHHHLFGCHWTSMPAFGRVG